MTKYWQVSPKGMSHQGRYDMERRRICIIMSHHLPTHQEDVQGERKPGTKNCTVEKLSGMNLGPQLQGVSFLIDQPEDLWDSSLLADEGEKV